MPTFAIKSFIGTSLKQIDKLISKSFIGPAILSYFIATFVLVMQFLWKYIDEILGKGLSILELIELIFYYAVTLIPMAVPITVLISSVMVFGDMAEKYELSSMKSAGISLLRIMVPSLVIASMIGLFSIFAANFLKPASLLQFNKRFLAIRKQKSALAIEQGIFNNAFNETIIRVDKIDKDKKSIHDVLIYDHSPNDKSLIGVLSAKGGEMYTAEEGRYFIMKLDTGIQYTEMERKTKLGTNKTEIPFMRTYFDQWTKVFDMNTFEAEDGLLNFNRNREDMMNTVQLIKSIDTFKTNVKNNNEKVATKMALLFSSTIKGSTNSTGVKVTDSIGDEYRKKYGKSNSEISIDLPALTPSQATNEIMPNQDSNLLINMSNRNRNVNSPAEVVPTSQPYLAPKKLVIQKDTIDISLLKYFSETIDSASYRDVIIRAQTDLSRDRDELLTIKNINYDLTRSYEKYLLRLNQQYSWALICVIFLFIGAPLGSIIRKGGYGYPLLVAILFYMIFIISTIFGEKLVKNESMGGIQAAWLPCLILLPWALLLTIMALRDIGFNPKAIIDFFYKFIKKKDLQPK